MSKAWTMLAIIIPTIGICVAAWLVSRWEPLSGCTMKFEKNRAIEFNVEQNDSRNDNDESASEDATFQTELPPVLIGEPIIDPSDKGLDGTPNREWNDDGRNDNRGIER